MSRYVSTSVVALSLAALFGCGGSSSTAPTPGSVPTAAPVPAPSHTATPDPVVAQCGSPRPTQLVGIRVKVHGVSGTGRAVLDSKPIVANVDGYCAKAGFGAADKFCDTRPEGHSERHACDAVAVGKAKDTGRWGPTWTGHDQPCGAFGSNHPVCVNHPDNQFLVIAKGGGGFLACAADDVALASDGSRCGGIGL